MGWGGAGARNRRRAITLPTPPPPSPPLKGRGSTVPLLVSALLQPLRPEHRPDIRILAVEGPEHRPVVHRVAAREDEVAEALAVGAGHAAVRLEPGEGGVVEHLRPGI